MIASVSDHILVLLALALDLSLGDPARFPHPVRLIGRLATALEASAKVHPQLDRRQVGYASLILVTVLTGLVVQLLINLPRFNVLAWLYLAYAGLALGQLLREGGKVEAYVQAGDLPGARQALAMLVSRDTGHLDPEDLRRTLAETLSENFNDGFVAPLFYLILFGPVGLWVFKAVSTLDSMWGYKTPQYKELGYAAAKADDILGYVPARLTAGIMALVAALAAPRVGEPARGRANLLARLLGLDLPPLAPRLMHKIKTDAARMESPNAGWPMAAAAWLCGAGMGGRAMYFGRPKHKPVLGPGGAWTRDKLRSLMRLMLVSGVLSAAILPWIWSLLCLGARGGSW